MSNIIYNIILFIYLSFVYLASIFNNKAKKWIDGRKHWLANHEVNLLNAKNIYWFHIASYGEFLMIEQLINEIKNRSNILNPFILVTIFSPSAISIVSKNKNVDYYEYLPFDFPSNAKLFLKDYDFKYIFFVKYEFWFNYFQEIFIRKIPFFILSANIRENQFFLKFKWTKRMMKLPSKYFVINESSKQLLKSKLELDAIIAGDLRMDKAIDNYQQRQENSIIYEFTKGKFTIIAGSSWEKEESIVTKYIQHNSNCKLIIAPHNIESKHIFEIEKKIKTKYIKHSQCNKYTDYNDIDVMIIDNIGILSNIYQYCDIAFIGGGFVNALHNILEPASFSKPIIMGNKTHKFPEAEIFISEGIAWHISSYNDFVNIVDKVYSKKEYYKSESSKNYKILLKYSNSNNKILEYLYNL